MFDEINGLLSDNSPFAIYRLPDSDRVCLVMQHPETEVNTYGNITDIETGDGFVMVPFDLLVGERPAIMIRADQRYEFVVSDSEMQYFDSQVKSCCDDLGEIFLSGEQKKYYDASFAEFSKVLQSGEFEKLVLSRRRSVKHPAGFSPLKTFFRALAHYEHSFVYLSYSTVSGMWLGSSPEPLLSGTPDSRHTVALAGTMCSLDFTAGAEWDDKNIREQRIVADYIRSALAELGIACLESETRTVFAGNLAHRCTDFTFRQPSDVSLGCILEALNPTPAVCGLPKIEAYRFILSHETFPRLYYSGFAGPLDSNGNVNLYVNIRCMNILQNYLSLYAGGGILAQSRADDEWNETENKLRTMLDIC